MWIAKIRTETRPDFPIILCGNKIDCNDRKVHVEDIRTFLKSSNPLLKVDNYFDISAKSLYNQDKPFLAVLRKMLGCDTIFTYGDEVVDKAPIEWSSDDE